MFHDIDLEGIEDGALIPENRTIVVVYDQKDYARDPLVLAHEIGHSLGRHHRPIAYMQRHKFPLETCGQNARSYPAHSDGLEGLNVGDARILVRKNHGYRVISISCLALA